MRYNKFYQTPYKKQFALALRKNPTEPEKLMWARLRNAQIKNNRFVRQKVILGWIADFYTHDSRLVVEIDGKQHDPIKDKIRDRAMNKAGIYVVRIPASAVFNDIESAVKKVSDNCLIKK